MKLIINSLLLISVITPGLEETFDPCEPPQTVRNGSYTPSKDYYYPNDTITYKCDDGFKLSVPSGNDSVNDYSCGLGGEWTFIDAPKCSGKNSSCNFLDEYSVFVYI